MTEENPATMMALTTALNMANDQLKAKQKRIEYLEYVLAQRIVETENKYSVNAKRFETIERQVLQIFRDYPAEPFTYKRIEVEAKTRLPHLSMENVGRRVRTLYAEGFLWRDKAKEDNSDIYQRKGDTQYWLKLVSEDGQE